MWRVSTRVEPDSPLVATALQALPGAGDVASDRQVLGLQSTCQLTSSGILLDSFIYTCLMDKHAKCLHLEDAHMLRKYCVLDV